MASRFKPRASGMSSSYELHPCRRERHAVWMASGMRFLNSDSLLNTTIMLTKTFVGGITGFTHGLEAHPAGNGIFCDKESGGRVPLLMKTETCVTRPSRTFTLVPKKVRGARPSELRKVFILSEW